MVHLTSYGGINEIGGNKILLEDGDRKLRSRGSLAIYQETIARKYPRLSI